MIKIELSNTRIELSSQYIETIEKEVQGLIVYVVHDEGYISATSCKKLGDLAANNLLPLIQEIKNLRQTIKEMERVQTKFISMQ